MSPHRENFDSWYKKVLELLYPHRDAGFGILLIAFPLLERYLRQKTGLTSEDNLSPAFFAELRQLFPALATESMARQFWQIYRNSLLHEITLSQRTRSGTSLPVGSLSHDKPMVTIEPNGRMWLNPVDFAQIVVATIELDFTTFEGIATSASRLPTVKAQPAAKDTGKIILGTNTDP